MLSMEARSNNRILTRNNLRVDAMEMVLGRRVVTSRENVTASLVRLITVLDPLRSLIGWQLMCLPRPEVETIKNQEKLSDLWAVCMQ